MACTGVQSSLRRLVRDASRSRQIPSFLVPALSYQSQVRCNSTLAEAVPQSRIGRSPINVPSEVNLRFYDLPKSNARSRKPDTPTTAVEVTGPLGMHGKALDPVEKSWAD